MTVTVTLNDDFKFANQDRSHRIAQNSANNQKEVLIDVAYDTETTDASGEIAVDLSTLLPNWNKIMDVYININYNNGFMVANIGNGGLDELKFIHISAVGAGDGSPRTLLASTLLIDTTYRVWVRGY